MNYCDQLQHEIVEFKFEKTNNKDLFANEIPIKKSQIPIVIGWNLESLLKTKLSN